MSLRAIELRRFSNRRGGVVSPGCYEFPWGADVAKLTGKMEIRFAVYFDESHPQYGNSILRHDREEGRRIREWLRGGVLGRFSVQSSYVYFEDEGDAVLCYMAFC